MKTIDYNAIQKEIHDNYLDLQSGILDVYDFTATIAEKYFMPIDESYGGIDENPYLDMFYGMLEINGIELY